MDKLPVAGPEIVGSNCTANVTAKPGLNVTGNVAPDIVKPAPLSVAEVMMTGAVPVELKISGCVEGVLIVALPNEMLLALVVNVGVDALSCSAKLLETPAPLAVIVAACGEETDDTFAVNAAVVKLAGKRIVAGTITAALLLAKLRLRPPLGAARVSVAKQAEVPAPVRDAPLHDNALNEAGGVVV
jgi:hypothetical protein